jgi:hypothetical protein
MRLPFLALLLISAASPAVAQRAPATAPPAAAAALEPVDPDRLAIAEEVVALAFPPEQRTAMMMQAGNSIAAQMRAALLNSLGGKIDPGLDAILQRFFERVHAKTERLIPEASPPLFVAIARAYARTFTRDELLQIRAFVATPAGTKYVRRSMDLLADPDVAEANTAYFQRAMKEMQPLQRELAQEVDSYLKKHPRAKLR